jgi:hypothetical protein
MHAFCQWCCTQLADLNDAIDAKLRDPSTIVEVGTKAVQSCLIERDLESLDEEELGWLVADIGMFVSSCIAHGFIVSHPTIVRCQELLKNLGHNLRFPPRENTYTYILLNRNTAKNAIRCFTHSNYEREFIFALQRTDQLLQRAADALRDVQLTAEDPLTRITDAAEALEAVEEQFRTMLADATQSHGEWFSRVYKSYFPSYKVDGVLWEAPSGAHLASVMELDLILGTADATRIAAIRQRLRYLTPPDRSKIMAALERPAVFLQTDKFPLISKLMLVGLQRVSKAFARAFGIHWALLNRILVRNTLQCHGGIATGVRQRNDLRRR